jgi:hypothetical protein
MTSDRKNTHGIVLPLALAALVGGVAAAGCGNYSNEDLEFMNALPQGDALRVEIPARSAALSPADEAELARMTHNVTRDFNGLLGTLVGIVDFVRSFPPTSRTPDSRIWGPFAADRAKNKNLDWQTRMMMNRDLMVADQFDYEIAVHHLGNADLDWPVFIRGWFQASQTARRGTGHVELVTADVRAEGLDVSDLGMLDHLEIDYDTLADPLLVKMTITNVRDPLDPSPPAMIVYTYKAKPDGQGQMTFDLFANIIPTPPPATEQMEHMNVTSRWLGTGEGRAQLTIVSGDGIGSQQSECWDSSFHATFNNKPWGVPGEDVPADPTTVDPATVCPNIPDL